MRDNAAGRISRNQREALYLLLVMERRGNRRPVPFVDLLRTINSNRFNDVARQNFYTGLRNARDKGLMLVLRDRSLRLSAALTDEGRQVAADIAARLESEE